MPLHSYTPHSEKYLRSSQINKLMDFRNWSQSPGRALYNFAQRGECPLSSQQWNKLKIDSISRETHDSKRFTLRLSDNMSMKPQRLNLPISCSFKIRGYNMDGKEVFKKYTPVSDSLHDGYLQFVIKLYADGELTPYLFSLAEHDEIEMSGPIDQGLAYPFAEYSKIGIIAGGTGITPFIQILKEMAWHEQYDSRFVTLLYGNKSMDDYLCQSDLMSLKCILKQRLDIHDFFETNTSLSGNNSNVMFHGNSWNDNMPTIGRINVESMKALLPEPSEDTLIMLCGTPAMKEVMYGKKTESGRELDGYLAQLGYTPHMIHVF